MKEKFGGLMKWGIGAFSLVMTNNLVVSVTLLVTGLFHVFKPERSLLFDSMILSILLALYALVSIVLVLTNYNQKIAKGQDVAGNIVKGFVVSKTKDAVEHQERLSKQTGAQQYAETVGNRRDGLSDRVEDIHVKSRSVSRNVMLVFYSVVLAASILLIIRGDIAVYLNHIILGIILLVDGVLSLISATSARNAIAFKNYWFSFALSLISVVLGFLFLFVTEKTGIFVMQVTGAILILKSIGEFYVAIRNREVLPSISDTVTQIKQQSTSPEESEKMKI